MAFDIDFLLKEIAGSPYGEYIVAFLVFIAAAVALKVFKHIIVQHLMRIAKKTKTELDDVIIRSIDSIGWPLYMILPLYIASQSLKMPEMLSSVLYLSILVTVTYYVVRGLQKLTDYAVGKMIKERLREEKQTDTSVIDLLGKLVKIFVWVLAVFFILTNLGYDITPMIAGLGVGGIAIAFALQNVLSDIFASFSIYFDKPFRVGDFIVIGNDSGIVKKIGIKSTRIQTLQGQELIVSNKELTESRINNYKRMERRRIVFTFGVTYSTTVKKLRKINSIVKDIIGKIENTDLDRVHFKNFGDFSLIYEVVYFVNSGDYNVYMDVQQKINLTIKERFEKEDIEMAFPTQTVYVHS
ncbi:MAG: mechanosensitive ion channel family protein [Candidatus Aenigmarchaeota archaeon]|nr:mechanosensitive ion channel family protein [Candidatus Aenigmarchaeota archaeon]